MNQSRTIPVTNEACNERNLLRIKHAMDTIHYKHKMMYEEATTLTDHECYYCQRPATDSRNNSERGELVSNHWLSAVRSHRRQTRRKRCCPHMTDTNSRPGGTEKTLTDETGFTCWFSTFVKRARRCLRDFITSQCANTSEC